ncbi:unnamed protein product [Rangifer tarandus platyrhynchus]|uniref:Uncharacterized protein n=1 Tax=Rangifer tarandus platyrhynchus TaxID=3082113 RepID=A0ABN8YPV1_RANTA|nr:unnamed protein product [Rangifer tarandus platyrhynchus]
MMVPVGFSLIQEEIIDVLSRSCHQCRSSVQPRPAESTTASTRPSRQSVLWPRCSGTVLARQLCHTRSDPSVYISAASGPHPGKQQTGGLDPPGSEPGHQVPGWGTLRRTGSGQARVGASLRGRSHLSLLRKL